VRSKRALLVCLLAVAAGPWGCAPRRLQWPSGDGEPFPEYAQALHEATASCRDVRAMSAELGISGRAGGQKLRGRVAAGIAAPASIRLEGAAPFGAPVFILAADSTRATLLLPRDNRVLTGEPPAAILESLVGLNLGPADLLAILSGCVERDPQPAGGRVFSGGWAGIDLAGGGRVYLQRDGRQRWQVRAASRQALRLEYERGASSIPDAVRIAADGDSGAGTDLRIAVSQPELNVTLGPEVFAVKIPSDAQPISLAELRLAGPMGERR
jgi:hypothetical protein